MNVLMVWDESSQVHVILTLLDGIKAEGQLLEDLLPSTSAERRWFIQELDNHGCYIQGKIMIETSWTHEEVTQQLHAWFLKVFEYIDNQWEHINGSAVHPAGIALIHFKGHQKAGVNESNLWFGANVVGMDIEVITNSESSDQEGCRVVKFCS
ncbi:hypothetical protein EDC04DRAFT_2609956 [Pisolithus marmoratus]|nr:hypothetical protein EDC04DRAFT_2609956 [Pisolithus marmoratus]